MCLSSHSILIKTLLFALVLCMVSPVAMGTSRQKRVRKKRPSHVISAQQARVASVKKAQLRRKLRGLSSHIRQVRNKIHAAKKQENQIHETIGVVEASITGSKPVRGS